MNTITRAFTNLLKTLRRMTELKQEELHFYASTTGRLYVKDDEFIRTKKVKNVIHRLLNSTIYREIKKQEEELEHKTGGTK